MQRSEEKKDPAAVTQRLNDLVAEYEAKRNEIKVAHPIATDPAAHSAALRELTKHYYTITSAENLNIQFLALLRERAPKPPASMWSALNTLGAMVGLTTPEPPASTNDDAFTLNTPPTTSAMTSDDGISSNDPVVADAGLADALGKLKADDLTIQKPQPQNNLPRDPEKVIISEPVLVSPVLKPAIPEAPIEGVPGELLNANEADEDEPKQNLRLADDEVDADEAAAEDLRIEAQAAYEVLLIAPDDIAEALANGDFNATTGVYRNAQGFADHVTKLQAEADAFEAYNVLIAAPEDIAEALANGDFNATTGVHRNAPGFGQYEAQLQTEADAFEAYEALLIAPETIAEALEDGGDFNAATGIHRNAPGFAQYETRLQEAALKHLETERIHQQEAAAAKALQEAYDKLIAKPEDIANALEDNGTFDSKISVHRNTPGFADRVKELQEAALKHIEAERIRKAREEAERVRQQEAAAKALKEAYDKLIAKPEGIAKALEENGAFNAKTSVHRNLPGFADYTAGLQLESKAFAAFQALIAAPEGIVKALGVDGHFNAETGVHRNAPGFSGYTTQLQTAEAARKQKVIDDAAKSYQASYQAARAAGF